MIKDPVMIDLDNYLDKQDPDFIDPDTRREINQEILERAADDACSTFKENKDER
mgnify:FL=1|tara:strand:+ start:782 stop:943 length:162 start_codon:yes stop_codon:yes gene_type:complete